MRAVITNGTNYIYCTDTKGVKKTTNINEAKIFNSMQQAFAIIKKAPSKTKNYYILDIDTKVVYWKYNTSVSRKKYSQSVRKMIYNLADGRCQLCGKRILYDSMSLDHIKPLSMGGADLVGNLQCTCKSCNKWKDNILPDLFVEKVTDVFMYQMDKKYGNKLYWKIAHRLLNKIV